MNSYDVMVVGTGFGGSVSAALLAQAGLKVLMIERGPWWGHGGQGQPAEVRRPFPHGPQARRLLRGVRHSVAGQSRDTVLNKDGWLELHLFKRLLAVTGSGVGGGSHVYTNILHQPDDDFWQGFPPEITAAEMAPHFAAIRRVMRPSPMPHRPKKNAVFEQAAAQAGLGRVTYPDLAIHWGHGPHDTARTPNAAGVLQGACNNCGCCILGCPTGAKTTLDLTFVPLALRAGAVLKPLCEVTAIGAARGGYVARWTNHHTGGQGQAFARRLVLAAGALNTLRLLLRARDKHATLPGLPTTLGRRFSPNGDLGAAMLFTPKRLNAAEGPAFNAFLRQPQRGGYEFLIGEVGLPLGALPLPGFVKKALGGSAMILAMGRDGGQGVVTFDGEGLRIDAGRDVGPRLFDRIEETVDTLAGHYQPGLLLNNAPAGRGAAMVATVHAMGGAAMARSPQEGVTDHCGQVFGHPGLYVADGALYPHPPGIPPSLTIAALARRMAACVVAQG